MMLTALQTNPGSSVFALHSNSAPNSAQQDRSNQTHVNGIAQCAMNKSSTTPPPSSSSSSPSSTNNCQGLTPQFIPMAPIPQPQVLIGPGGSYTILPSITSLSGADTTAFGNLTSLHPITGGFSHVPTNTAGVSSTSGTPITAVQAAYYPNGHRPTAPSAREGGASTSGGRRGGREMYRNSSSPVARQFATPTVTTTPSPSSAAAIIVQRPRSLQTEHSTHSGTQSRLMQNGNRTSIPDSHSPSSDTKPNMSSLLVQQQSRSPLHPSGVFPPDSGPLTSSSSDPSLHHSSGGSNESSSVGDRLLDPSPTPAAGKYENSVLPHGGSRRSSHTAMELGQTGVLPVEIKREPEDTPPAIQSCSRRHSDSSNGTAADASNMTNVSLSSGATAGGSKNSPYPVSALIDVPIITPLNRSSRTSSLSSSLSSFRFGGSLSQLWASQISLSAASKISNMKSTGNLHAEAAAMPSLGNQYFAFGGSLPELSLTSLTRLLPNSSANDPNISSCPSLFTLFHPPLYVYPSQQHLTTPFINPNGSISFGSFLSSGTSLCSMQKSSAGTSGATGSATLNPVMSSSSNSVGASTAAAATGSISSTIITGKENKIDDSPGVYGRSPLAQQHPAANQGGEGVKLSAVYSPLSAPIIGGAQVIAALPGFSTLATARGFPDPVTAAAAAAAQQSHSGSITSHTISASTHSNLAPLYSSTIAPTTTVSHVATAPNCDLNTLACVATAQMQQQQKQGIGSPHHLPIPHPSTEPHLHHAAAATTPTPQGGGALGSGGSATPPSSHDSKEGILAALHGGVAPIEVYGLGGGNPSPLIPGTVGMNQIDDRMTHSPVDMSGGQGGLGGQLVPMDMGQAHMQGQQSAAMSPGGGEGMKVKKEKDKPYKCDHPGCGRSFSFPAHLRSHIQQIHISYRPCKCEFPGCGKRFYTPQHLNVHRRVHTGERPFICPYADCGKAFTTAGNLKNHIRTHTGERPYACKYDGCLKRFAEMSSLKKHELTHTGEKPYKCRVCGKAFSQAGSRNTHERKHNPMSDESTAEMPSDSKASGRRYRIRRVPVVANGAPTAMMDDAAMQH